MIINQPLLRYLTLNRLQLLTIVSHHLKIHESMPQEMLNSQKQTTNNAAGFIDLLVNQWLLVTMITID